MSNAVKILSAGMLPLLAGILFHYLLMSLPAGNPLMLLLALALLAAWVCLAYRVSKSQKNPVIQAFLLSAFGLLMLALALYQELIMGRYWLNFLGLAPQMYFLPFVPLTSLVTVPFTDVMRPWPAYIVIWAGLFLTGWLGCWLKRRRA